MFLKESRKKCLLPFYPRVIKYQTKFQRTWVFPLKVLTCFHFISKTERQTEHRPLTHFPNACKNQGWASQKARAQNLVQVSQPRTMLCGLPGNSRKLYWKWKNQDRSQTFPCGTQEIPSSNLTCDKRLPQKFEFSFRDTHTVLLFF